VYQLLESLRRAFERLLSGTTPASRCLMAIALASPFFIIYLGLHQIALVSDTIRPGVRPPVLWILQAVLALATLVLAGAWWHLWPRRHQTDPVTGVELLVALSIGLGYVGIAVCAGAFSAAPTQVLMGVLTIGLMLLQWRTMLIAFLVCAPMFGVFDALMVLDVVPYAPAVTAQAFHNGEPVWWWSLWRHMVFHVGWVVVAGLIFMFFGRLDAVHAKLNRLSTTDVLTGLANRRAFMARLNAELRRQARTGRPMSLVLVDADHFKRINDTHGHPAGDQVLAMLGRLLSLGVRTPVDMAARLGGEEFALLLPDTTVDEAEAVCWRLQQALAAESVRAPSGDVLRLTVSMGVVEGVGQRPEQLLRQADTNLYQAKAQGRNRAVYSVLGPLPSEVPA
jgi:diguanylate cyclase (GGDEF)-like protein